MTLPDIGCWTENDGRVAPSNDLIFVTVPGFLMSVRDEPFGENAENLVLQHLLTKSDRIVTRKMNAKRCNANDESEDSLEAEES
jgi:hypothetical protein